MTATLAGPPQTQLSRIEGAGQMANDNSSAKRSTLLDNLLYASLADSQEGSVPLLSFEEVFGELGPAMRSLHVGHFVLDLMNDKDDRSAAILGQAFVEELVLRLVSKALLDGKASRQLLALDGPLGAFMPRVKLAVALGLISSDFARLLRQMAIIRNAFAHSFELASFEEIAGECAKLRQMHAFADFKGNARQQFHMALFYCNHHLAKVTHRATPRELLSDEPITGLGAAIE
jgi:hypothetical protein